MRLYLSSYRFGAAKDQFLDLIGNKKRVAIIENALDMYSDAHRSEYKAQVYNPYIEMEKIGIKAYELDLRKFIGQSDKLYSELKTFGAVWVLGGNVFLLRRAMKLSGFDSVIKILIAKDTLVYGGFSAGAVVAGPTLKGIDIIDNPNIISKGYDPAIVWEGLALVPYSIVPHFKSLHPESASAERAVKYMTDKNIEFRAMQDGDVIIYDQNTYRYVRVHLISKTPD